MRTHIEEVTFYVYVKNLFLYRYIVNHAKILFAKALLFLVLNGQSRLLTLLSGYEYARMTRKFGDFIFFAKLVFFTVTLFIF